jgi:hypothetical protein
MKPLAALLVASAALAVAQQPQPGLGQVAPRTQKIFQIKHVNPCQLASVLQSFGSVRCESGMRLLTVEGSPEAIAAIEDALKRLDVPAPPPKNVELTFHMLLASPKPDGKEKLPADLEGVARNLTSVFGYKGFVLLETMQLRARDGDNTQAEGVAPLPPGSQVPDSQKTVYMLQCRAGLTPLAEKGWVVRLDNLRFSLRIPYAAGVDKDGKTQYSVREAGFRTQIDVRDNQKIVVGKANMDGSDGAVILVVIAKVVD